MFIIYCLKLENGNLYVGMTSNLEKRIKDHQRGQTKTTKNKKILKIFKIESYSDIKIARKREKYWKSGCGKELLKSKINIRGRSSAG